MCKLLTFVLYYGTHVSSWTVVGVSVARAISIWLPLRSQTWRNKTAIPYLVIILSIFFIVDLPFLIDAEIISINLDSSSIPSLSDIISQLNMTGLGNIPGANDTYIWNNTLYISEFTDILDDYFVNNTQDNMQDNSMDNAEYTQNDFEDIEIHLCLMKGDSIYGKRNVLVPFILVLVLSFAVPCLIITLSNSLIIVKLVQRVRTFNKESPSRGNIRQSRMTSLTLRILILGVVHIVSTIAIAEVTKATSFENEVMFLNQTTLYRFFNLLFYLNSGVNFILYCLLGNEFRQDLYNILRISKS